MTSEYDVYLSLYHLYLWPLFKKEEKDLHVECTASQMCFRKNGYIFP